MNAREEILSAIRARQMARRTRPAPYRAPVKPGDPVAMFTARASAVQAEVRELASMDEVPAAIADILRARNLAARVHLPPNAALDALPWSEGMTRQKTPPGPDDTAIAVAPFAVAETGTLVYGARTEAPASWHFRPGLEIAILRAGTILPQLEDVLAKLRTKDGLPRTVNLVSGPSRTGDIEQTIELGAHGPKALAILIVKD